MRQAQSSRSEAKVLQRYPKIVYLTEARKRAIAGARAGIEEALRHMTAAAERPISNVLEYDNESPRPARPETANAGVLREQQQLINRARSAAQAAQLEPSVIEPLPLEGAV